MTVRRPTDRAGSNTRSCLARRCWQDGSHLSPRRLHRHQHGAARQECRGFLQQARNMRAVDQGRQGRDQMDAAVPSCRTFPVNAIRLQVHALAYNLGNFLRTLATPEPIKDWSLTSLKEKLIKIGERWWSHGRYVVFPDGRGRHPTADVPGDFAIDRGTTAAATASARVRRRSSRIQEHPTGGVRPNASGK